MKFPTIVAMATPLLESAIGIVRLSGDEAISIVNEVFDKDLTKVNSHQVVYGHIYNNGEILDEVMVSVFRAPKTYTREDMVEISFHGSPIILNNAISLFISKGCVKAERGEFTKRAYLNGRIDLVQSEAINDIIHGETMDSISLAMNGLNGNVSNLIKDLKKDLEDVIAAMEVNIDYPEYYDIEVETHETIKPKIESLIQKCDLILKDAKIGNIIKNGIKTSIVGKPNVGKSSLLNNLIGENKAIVTNVPGTTRDIVEGQVVINGIKLALLDTAGIHSSNDEVELIGIDKSYKSLKEAELVLLVLDASRELEKEDYELLKLTENKNKIVILNKLDLGKKIEVEGIDISIKNNDLNNLKEEISKKLGFSIQDYRNKALLTSSRQIGLLAKANDSLKDMLNLIEEGVPFDILSVDIKLAYDSLKEILGEVATLGYDEAIFSRFCVGK